MAMALRSIGYPAGLGLAVGLMGLAGCATAPVQSAGAYASQGAHVTYQAASTGVHAVYATGGDVYSGVGTVAKRPFRDLNMMQDPIPVVLIRAESQPYDLTALTSCEAILDKVAELDLALGPDLDAPKDRKKDRTARAATLAAAAALDAASSAAEGFLPMRSVIKHVSGASRYEEHVKHAILAGTERRSFLKAVGMQHNCSWPAAPLGFHPVVVAVETAPLAVPPLSSAPRLYANASPSVAASGPVRSVYANASSVAAGAQAAAAVPVAAASTSPPAQMVAAAAPTSRAAMTAVTWTSPSSVIAPAYGAVPASLVESGAARATMPSAAMGAPWGASASSGR